MNVTEFEVCFQSLDYINWGNLSESLFRRALGSDKVLF